MGRVADILSQLNEDAPKKAISADELKRWLVNRLKAFYNRDHWEKYGKNDYMGPFEDWQRVTIDLILYKSKFALNYASLEGIPGYVIDTWLPKDVVRRHDRDGDEYSRTDYIAALDSLFKQLGYFVSSYKGGSRPEIRLEAFRTNEVTDKVPDKLYTFTAAWNKDTILRKGLVPKAQLGRPDFRYPSRIFLFKEYNQSHIEQMRMAIASHGHSAESIYYGGVEVSPIVVFEVDTTKLNRGTKFYTDSASAIDGEFRGVWTPTHIPSVALKVIYEDPWDPSENNDPF